MPRDGTATRARILDAAQRLVIDNGFNATTVDAVLAAAGTSKGAFFHHFASKQDLAAALVDKYVAADLEMLELGLAAARAAGDDPVERAVAFVRWYEEQADEIMAGTTGCLYTSVLAEMELVEAGTSDPITKAVVVWREEFAALLRDALPARSDVDVDALSDHVWVTFEGAFLLARTTSDPGHMRRQLRVMRVLLESLLRG
ncbi:TetR/AcrR family transcriptional regulator [Nocardioides sp. TF02-7]|uniref:TetR/AcrR family transcriptional regulator n=1 Tax=Nocardioides sp. TF02-7 TaxID=2917724 RepID=UPI001F05BE2E|nr:TetR/AcrR family transcriptional regulator [Nocardioides sp. TF02-7]UMG91316.1 TetR/AcrR family transcriptional regulator [Nocardioides sp. TF02-7]